MTITVRQAAIAMDVSERRVRAMIKKGQINAERFGRRMYKIEEEDLLPMAYRRPGKPKKRIDVL